MNITVLSKFGESLDLCYRLQSEGHKVKFCIFGAAGDQDIGKNIVPLSKTITGLNADLIIIDDVGMGGLADRLRKSGRVVVGGSVITDRMENDREFGHEVMKGSGIKAPKAEMFDNFNKAREYVKSTGKRYVFKPFGQKQRFLTHVSKDADEMIAMMSHFEKVWPSDTVKFELQEFVDGLEIACSGWFNGTTFAKPILINFEHKKLMNEDIGPNTGEMSTIMAYRMKSRLFNETLAKVEAFLKTTGYRGFIDLNCYDEATEVLTDNGWKTFDTVSYADKVATLENGKDIVFQHPTNIIGYGYEGEMISTGGARNSLDFCVTPNHRMYVASRQRRKLLDSDYRLVNALDLNNKAHTYHYIKRHGEWVGSLPENPIINSDLCEFFGLWLAEGSAYHTKDNHYRVVISQKTKIAEVKKILDNSKLHYTDCSKHGYFLISNKELCLYLTSLGHSFNKYIPKIIKNYPKELLQKILDGFFLGDGHLYKSGTRGYFSSSKQLADDIQELLFKCGKVATIRVYDNRGRKSFFENHECITAHLGYTILERSTKFTSTLWHDRLKSIDYKGMVYCVTVPSGIIYVRRNGKPMWCGNCIATEKGAYGLEWTSRFGYPTVLIQDELHRKGTWGSFLYHLGLGVVEHVPADTSKWCVGVAVCTLPWPLQNKSEQFKNRPVWLPENLDHIHLSDVWLDGKQYKQAGETGYICVCTGSAVDLKIAKELAYKELKKVHVPGGMWRTDIGNKVIENLPTLRAWRWV